MSLFGDLSYLEFATALRSAVAAFGKVDPPKDWTALKMADLGVDGHGTTFTSRNGRGHAIVLEHDGQLIVSFRGTDKLNDLKDYDNISASNNYFLQFQSLLKSVADYKQAHGLSVTFTGISLGAAVVNIIASKADHRWGNLFDDASFVGISSPLLKGNRKVDLYNFGFSNDEVYHLVPGSWRPATRDTATKYVFSYENHRYLKDDNLDDRFSVHGTGHVLDAVRSLQDLTIEGGQLLADKLNPHSYVLFDNTSEIVNAGRLHHPGNSPLSVIGEGRADRLYGASNHRHGSDIEWFFGQGGNDLILGHGGADKLYGGDGEDRLVGGKGADFLSGDNGDDTILMDSHRDRASGGAGDDKFVVTDILPHNDQGRPTQSGNNPAQIFIEDFLGGADALNLHALDGNLNRKGRQDLHFAGFFQYDDSDGLSDLERGFVNDSKAGSVTIFEDQSGDTLVIINRDGDRARELEIVITGHVGDIHADLYL